METINSQFDDMEEMRAIIGFEEPNESENKNIFKDLILTNDLIENTWNLISIYQNNFITLDYIKSNGEVLSRKSNDRGKLNIRAEKLFDNFSQFLEEKECKNLKFTISEKSPSTLLDTIYPNLENNSKDKDFNFSIDFSGFYSSELKNNFINNNNVTKDNRIQKNRNENRDKDSKRELHPNEYDMSQFNSQNRNRNNDKKKNNNMNYNERKYEHEDKYKHNHNHNNNINISNNENDSRRIFDERDTKEKENKHDKFKNNQENAINSSNNNNNGTKQNEISHNKDNPKYVKTTLDEMFEDKIKFEVQQIDVNKYKRDDKNYNGGRKKTDHNNYQNQNYQNYDNKSDYYYAGDNYNDYTDYSNGNFYNSNIRNQNNGYNGTNGGYNGHNGKNKRYRKNKY